MKWLLVLLNLTCFSISYAQTDSVLYKQLWKKNKTGMFVLSSWGAINITESIYFTSKTNANERYFHQMNGLWNTVNLGLGIAGIIKSHRMLKSPDYGNYPQNILKVEKAYRINFYIDFGYIGGGALLYTLNSKFKNPDLAAGYGQSIITQGIFLLGFDYFMSRMIRRKLALH